MRALVMLNAAAGTLVSSSDGNEDAVIRSAFARHGWAVDVRHVPGKDLANAARSARDSGAFDLIVAGGGDGTLNTIGGALVGGRVPFAVLPLGTFNHLARELEMPMELEAAIDAIVDGRDVPLAVGKVNDHHFLSFAAIGVYSEMIKHRDAQRKARGRRKMWAGAIAGCKMLFRWPLRRVRIYVGDAEPIRRVTPVLYVSLSGVQIDQMNIAGRPERVRDRLNVFVATQRNRFGLLMLMARAMVGHVRTHRDVELFRVNECRVEIRGYRYVRVGYDGEVETMKTPLHFELIPAGLLVRVPRDASKYVAVPAAAAAAAAPAATAAVTP